MAKVIFTDDEDGILSMYRKAMATDVPAGEALARLAEDFFAEEGISAEPLHSDLARIDFALASQGDAAVELVREGLLTGDAVQVAFIDMRMPPGIDGKQTAKMIREIDPRVEIVIVTAYSDTPPEKLLSEIGRADKVLFLRKPFDLAEIRQLVRNLTAKYKSESIKDDFIGNVTHELKTPLASVLGFMELAESEITESNARECVRIAHSNAMLMRVLIADLIEAITISREGPTIHKVPTDLVALMQESYVSLRSVHEKAGLEMAFTSNREKLEIPLDPDRIRQVLYNIVGNAMKFTDEGSVTLSLEDREDCVVLRVADTGPGIPEQHLPRIFEKFFRGEEEHHTKPGLGLGLHIVRTILEAHQVHYAVHSKQGTGTCFELSFTKEVAA